MTRTLVHHVPLDPLAALAGKRIIARVVRGGVGDDGFTADEVQLLVWSASAAGRHYRLDEVERVVVLSGTIEAATWIALSVRDIVDPDLVALGIATRSHGRLELSDFFSIQPTPRALVTGVTVSEETFVVDDASDDEPVTITADCRIDIHFSAGDPLCFEAGAAGVGYLRIHRALSQWTGVDPRNSSIRKSLEVQPTPFA